MVFSGIDTALLQRAARLLEAQARGIEFSKTNGGSWAGARAAKREFDALMRDARDLRSVVKRFAAPPTPRKPKVIVPPVVENQDLPYGYAERLRAATPVVATESFAPECAGGVPE